MHSDFFLDIMSIWRWCRPVNRYNVRNTKQKSVQDDNSFFMTSFNFLKGEWVSMLFLVSDRTIEPHCTMGTRCQNPKFESWFSNVWSLLASFWVLLWPLQGLSRLYIDLKLCKNWNSIWLWVLISQIFLNLFVPTLMCIT